MYQANCPSWIEIHANLSETPCVQCRPLYSRPGGDKLRRSCNKRALCSSVVFYRPWHNHDDVYCAWKQPITDPQLIHSVSQENLCCHFRRASTMSYAFFFTNEWCSLATHVLKEDSGAPPKPSASAKKSDFGFAVDIQCHGSSSFSDWCDAAILFDK